MNQEQINRVEETQKSEKSKAGLYMLIGAGVVVVIAFAVVRGIIGGVANTAATAAARAAGVNLINNGTGGATYSDNNGGSVTVGGNKLPDNWPSDAPKYPDANIQYSGTSNPQTGEAGSAIVFTTGDSAQSVSDFYKKQLAADGWTIEQTANMGASSVLSAKKDTRTFAVYITDSGSGQTSVTVGITIPQGN